MQPKNITGNEKLVKARSNRLTLKLGKPFVAVKFGKSPYVWVVATPLKHDWPEYQLEEVTT